MFTTLTTFLTKSIRLVTFYESSALACQFLIVAQLIETSTTKTVFLWYRSQRDLHLFCKFGMTCTLTKNVEKFISSPKISGFRQACVNRMFC